MHISDVNIGTESHSPLKFSKKILFNYYCVKSKLQQVVNRNELNFFTDTADFFRGIHVSSLCFC